MSRPATGQVLERRGKRGRTFALRFRAYGERHYVTLGAEPDWTRKTAEQELERTLAAVKLGVWQPAAAPTVETPREVPTFHVYASTWHDGRKRTVKPRTTEWEAWALTNHLLAYFSTYAVDAIDAQTVRGYVIAKQAEETLSARSLNSTLRVLSLILSEAVEDGYLDANPVTRKRFVKAARPARGWLQPDELADLLDACTDRSRALVATMAYVGLRVSETASLRWRAVDLANGRIAVEASKTDAGRRVISDLNPELLDLLKAHRLQSKRTGPDDLVFGTTTGREKTRSSISRQVLKAALDRANSKRIKQGQPPIARATAHDLRRTFAALCYAAGATPPAVMAAMGHTSAALALEVYAKVVAGSTKGLGESMARLVRGPDWAQTGTNDDTAASTIAETANGVSAKVAA